MSSRKIYTLRLIITTLLSSAIPATAENSATRPKLVDWQTPLKIAPNSVNDEQENVRLDFRDPAPLIFDSLRSMLRQRPSVYAPNGHSIVPCVVPAWTKLYHSRLDDQLPPSPEWLAFNIEAANVIFGAWPTSHMLTYRTVKPTKVLYFDGSSASPYGGKGQTDSQDLLIDHRVSRPPMNESAEHETLRWLDEEYRRGAGLCNWISENGVGGPGWGVEGIVRMNIGFELIWCNFTSSSLQLLSNHKVATPTIAKELLLYPESEITKRKPFQSKLSARTTSLGEDSQAREAFLNLAVWDYYRVGTWHDGKLDHGASIGEYRVKPLLCGMTSLYDHNFTSISDARISEETIRLNLTADGYWKGVENEADRPTALKQLQRRRRNHDLQASTSEDAIRMAQNVRERLLLLISQQGQPSAMHVDCEGPDWVNIMMDVVLRYGQPIRECIRMLEDTISYTSREGLQPGKLAVLRDLSHTFLVPFLEYPESAFCDETSCQEKSRRQRIEELEIWRLSSTLGQTTLERCQNSYLPYSYTSDAPDSYLPGDIIYNDSIANTTFAICRVIIHFGFNIERLWFTHYGSNIDVSPDRDATTTILTSLRNSLQELESYLGWVSDDMTCTPGCSVDELCFVPMWPLLELRNWNMSYSALHDEDSLSGRTPNWKEHLWEPVCIKSFLWREGERFKEFRKNRST